MKSDQARKLLSDAVWDDFNKWVAKETCLISKDATGHQLVEYLDGDVEKYIEHVFHLRSHTTPPRRETAAKFPATDKYAIEFALEAPQARSVTVAGTFNDWSPTRTPLSKGKDGIWREALLLQHGRYEYRFVVDGQWRTDPKAQNSVTNPHGSQNSVIEV